MEESHEFYMEKCIALAKIATKRGDSPVGSILVQDGIIIGEGIEGNNTYSDITFHAEIEAIRRATEHLKSQDLSQATLYTTHEPCIMCSYVIRHTKIRKVVIGVPNKETGGVNSPYPLLLDTAIAKWKTPPILIPGILEDECRTLHS